MPDMITSNWKMKGKLKEIIGKMNIITRRFKLSNLMMYLEICKFIGVRAKCNVAYFEPKCKHEE